MIVGGDGVESGKWWLCERENHCMVVTSEEKRCEKQSCDTEVREEGGQDVLQVPEQTPLQTVEETTVEQVVPLQPIEETTA